MAGWPSAGWRSGGDNFDGGQTIAIAWIINFLGVPASVTPRDCVTLTRDPEQIERFDVRYLEIGGEEAATWSWSIVNLGNGVKL